MADAVILPRPGVRQWVNPKNRLTVLELHYTADPVRRGLAWRTAEKANYPDRAWRREQEIDWTAPEGEPVIPEYEARTHCVPLTRDRNLRLLRFWDFGHAAPVVLFAQLPAIDQLQVLAELCPFNTPLAQLLPMMQAMSAELGAERVFDSGDPAGFNTTDLGSSVDVLLKHGIRLIASRPGTEISYANLRQRFLERRFVSGIGQVPAIVIDHARCPMLNEALAGAFARGELPPYKPRGKHPFKDCVDALRYGNDNLSHAAVDYRAQLRKMAVADARW